MSLKSLHNLQRAQQGFNLLELLFVVAIAAVVVAIGVPTMTNIISSNRLSSEYNRFIGDLILARSEAVNRGVSVSLCPSTDQSTCTGGDWENGWIIFVDDGAGAPLSANNRDRDGAEEIIRVGEGAQGTLDIRSEGFTDGGGILFSNDGKIEQGTTANIGVLIICNESGATKAKGVEFSAFGQLRNMRDTDADGVADYLSGGATVGVTCP